MKIRLVAIVSAAIASLAVAVPAHAEWLEARSKHFVTYGDMPADRLRARVERLERFDAALRGLFRITTDDKATLYIVSSMSDVQRLAQDRKVGGFYTVSAQDALGVVPERMPNGYNMNAEAILFHEYTHHMLLSNTSQFFPGWVTEGLAELFMSARFDASGDVIIGAPNDNRGFAMLGMSRWTVRRLLESDARLPTEDERIERYSRGWLLCHYLLISGQRQGQFFKFIDLLNGGLPAIEAGQQAFGDLDRLNAEIERYVRASKLPSSVISADKVVTDMAITVRSLTPGENAILPFRMVSAVGVDEKTAAPLAASARPVAARYPQDPFVQRAMAEINYDAKAYDLAEAAANSALAADPSNVMAIVYRGRVAAQRALAGKDPEQWRTARRLFLQANRMQPDYALPFVLYYDSFIAAGQTPPADAVNGLRRAVVLVPADTSLRARAGIELIRMGDLKMARTVLAPVAFDPHGQADNPYTKLVKALDDGADRAAALVKIDELKLGRINEFDPPKPAENAAKSSGHS